MRGLESILSGAAKPEPETPDGDDLGPCASRPAPKGWPGLHVFNGREDTRAFQYHHLGLESFAADGTSFVVEWNVPEKWRLTAFGRDLWRIFLGIHHHKLECQQHQASLHTSPCVAFRSSGRTLTIARWRFMRLMPS